MSNHVIHNLISVSDLQRAPGKILKRLGDTHAPLVITQRGRPVAVLSIPEQPIPNATSPSATPVFAIQRREALLAALQKMLPVIISKYAPDKIVLFGSLATSRVHEGSDIDLLIVKDTSKRFLDRQMDVMRIADPQVATDFFVYTPEELAHGVKAKPHFFQDEVLAKGQVLYEKNG